jgi:L-cysteine S-thiosulfotransferase
MAKPQISTVLAMAVCVSAAIVSTGPGEAYGAECKRKKAGFYLQDTDLGGPRRLSISLQGLPPSLTGVPGDAERGRDVLANRQKGDCLSCHKLSALSSVGGQGGIGPALDGIASKYNDGQLRQVLMEPKAYFPDTIMPSYYRPPGSAEASVLTAAEIEDLVAYMTTLK